MKWWQDPSSSGTYHPEKSWTHREENIYERIGWCHSLWVTGWATSVLRSGRGSLSIDISAEVWVTKIKRKHSRILRKSIPGWTASAKVLRWKYFRFSWDKKTSVAWVERWVESDLKWLWRGRQKPCNILLEGIWILFQVQWETMGRFSAGGWQDYSDYLVKNGL